ncbi:hypothetical protein ACVSUC_20830 [Yersinia enterocolitica]|uniref:hypothetical protein n=1 Tax=unclassified Yersinia (in: enterobacteria) TaxID=2653513 RepID=UPI001BAF0EDF|nr:MULTISPECIES: hypothetical protein [unclassified Yersinia (in: enterobacteria)]MBS0057678.1 hypothetical protein [Yersinia sp. Marseille-Q3913]
MYNNLPALTDNVLWDDRLLSTEYAELDEAALRTALQDYLRTVDTLQGEWHLQEDSPLSLWIARHDQLALYQQGLLSVERIILVDALEEASLRLNSIDMAAAVDLFVQNDASDRGQDIRTGVAQFVRFTKENFTLIQAGFIAFTRCDSMHEDQIRRMQLLEDNSSQHFLYSVMPPAVARLYERNLHVRGVVRVSHEGHVRFVSEKTLPGEIMLELDDCLSPYTNGHIFQNLRPVRTNEDGTLTVEITRGKPENRRSYDRWVQGAANRSIFFHYKTLITDLGQAARSRASLATRCPLQGKILEKIDNSGRLSRRMLDVETPFLAGLSLQDIFRIRTDYEPSFTAYRRSLRDCALDIERAANPAELHMVQARFRERIADEGLAEVREKLGIWKRRSLQDTALLAIPAVLGFAGSPMISTLATGAASLLHAALGAYRGRDEVIHHPSYFLIRSSGRKP